MAGTFQSVVVRYVYEPLVFRFVDTVTLSRSLRSRVFDAVLGTTPQAAVRNPGNQSRSISN